jgi:pilus assembly protein CpaC
MSNIKRVTGWLTAALVISTFVVHAGLPVLAAETDDEKKQSDHEQIGMSVGRSHLLRAPWPVAKVSVAEPGIADVQVAAPDQVVVLAKSVGRTDVVLWNEDGETVINVIDVHVDLIELQQDLDRIFPGTSLRVDKSRDLVTIHGLFNRAEQAQRLREYLEAAEIKHIDLTSVAGVQQVLIRVRIADASRTALRSLGVDTFYNGSDFFGGSILNDLVSVTDPVDLVGGGGGALGAVLGGGTTLFAGIPDADLTFFLEALEDNQYMRTLAEPSLVAASGEEASFLAGGEFPIPVVQDAGGGAGGSSITIEFKEFGIRLTFRPTVLGDNTIRLQLAPEVSQLSDVGAVQIEGFSIPSLVTRRAQTTLEMHSGQTFALAGLIDQQTAAQSRNTPGLGNVPVLGALFRSVRYEQLDTELVVLATVSLVEPLSIVGDRPVPGDLHDEPDDWELYANGHIEGRTPDVRSEAHAEWMRERGLGNLKGPGAWQSHFGAPTSSELIPAAPADDAGAEAAEAEAMPEAAEAEAMPEAAEAEAMPEAADEPAIMPEAAPAPEPQPMESGESDPHQAVLEDK